jgi:hypothetical protein
MFLLLSIILCLRDSDHFEVEPKENNHQSFPFHIGKEEFEWLMTPISFFALASARKAKVT